MIKMFSDHEIMTESNGSVKRSEKFKEETIINPFIRDKNFWDKDNELLDKVKVNIPGDISIVSFKKPQ